MTLTPLQDDMTLALKTRAMTALDVTEGLGAFPKDSYLRDRQWGAVIFEGDFHDAGNLVSKGVSAATTRPVYCVGLADYMTDGYELSSEKYDFSEARKKYHEPSYFITDDFDRFIIVSDSDYYWAIAADRDLLIDLFGTNIPPQLKNFADDMSGYLSSADHNDKVIGQLLRNFLHVCSVSCARLGLVDADVPVQAFT